MPRRNSSITVGSSITGNTTPIKVDHATSTTDDRKNKPWKRYDLLAQGFCELAAAEKEEFQELVTKDREVHSVDDLTDWHEYYLEMLGVSSTDDDPSFYRASTGAEIPPVARDLLNAPSAFSGFDYANSDWELSRSVYAAGLFTASIKGPLTASPSAYPTLVTMVHCIVNEINREDAAVTGNANANATANANAAATNSEPAAAGPSRQDDGQPPPPPLRPPPPTPPRPTAGPAPSRSRLRVAPNHHPKITHYRPAHNRLDVYEARCDLAVLSGLEPHVHCGILGRGRAWDQNSDGALEVMQTFLALCQEERATPYGPPAAFPWYRHEWVQRVSLRDDRAARVSRHRIPRYIASTAPPGRRTRRARRRFIRHNTALPQHQAYAEYDGAVSRSSRGHWSGTAAHAAQIERHVERERACFH
ncbi:hypothetical protein ASPACDRAFT_63198 [Aspergillus aculeatus ATCC 16872]|uniref:Uncharacterized protein n=1 Tax=Aspergillus aculeatus (strain ATCC 16872 / CBS 172.66 / WB 5094) TaxID=690307 RepID=A0A1L9WL40_ASPA1|nr:uncharacterized protein ASPACDRAFT_63198 [Aspergillus aculeatus ATCC 16872]OJJ96879.1 hypothetical protein ASPACDRAFT_63198 [Aspergillus aculeatus ATCC 16872]